MSDLLANRRMKNWGLTPFSLGLRFYLLMVAVLLSTTLSSQALANASVTTLATASVAGDNFPNSTWVSLTGPVLTEGAHRDIPASGTIVLNAPTGFIFNTVNTVTVTVARVAGSSSLVVLASGGTATVAASTITITVTARDGGSGGGTTRSSLTWSGIQVRPTACGTVTGNITKSGTATIAGITNGTTSFGTLTETVCSQTITYTSTAPGSATVGGATYTPTATGGASGNAVTFTVDASASSVCSISAGVVSFIGAGTCLLDANQAGNANYNAAPQKQQSFAVGKGSQTITYTSAAPGSATVGGATYTPAATGGASGNAVTITVDATASGVCSISAGVVSFIGTGNCVLDANQTGNANYNAAPQVPQSFSVNNPAPTTTSISPTSKNIGDVGFSMTVNGTNFVAGSVVQFAGSSRTTTYVSATQLTATILTSDMATAGAYSITVVNSAPGGGTSNAQTFTTSPLTVVSINRADTDPTSAATVRWTVTFSTSVTGVAAGNFALVQAGGVSGASITSVTGSGTTWTVTANTGSGYGTLGLNMSNVTGVSPSVTTAMPFVGQVYTIPAPPVPLAYYRMDEASWNGTANQVADSSGNGNNAQSFNNASTDGTTPAIPGNPGTCFYGVFDNTSTGGTINQGYVETPLPNLTTDFTVTAWIRTTNNTVGGQRILIDDQNNSGGYGISLADGATGIIRFYSRGITPVILDSTYTIASNTWYFVAVVADITNRKRTIYVYSAAGALLASTSDAAAFTGTWGNDAGPVSIGGETNASGESPATYHFRGNLDEVSVYQAALSQTELAAIATQTHVCALAVPDHLEIDASSATGLTCTPSTLTIKACADAACATAYTGGVTGTMSATGTPTVNWSGGSSFSIPAIGTVNKDVQVTTPGSVVFNATSTPAASKATTCNFGTNSPTYDNCEFTASDTGFLVSAPNHAAESSSTLTVQAVKKADNSLACVPAFASTSKTVNLKCTYSNPATGTLPVRIGGTVLNAAADTAAACDGAGANVTLSFDATGTATPALQYADVGKMNVSAAYTGIAGSLDASLSMTGTGSFIAAPASFGFSAITGGPIKAGNSFSATVSALNNSGAVTPNFGKDTTAEGVTLTSTLVTPNPVTYPAAVNPTPGNNIIPGSEFGAGGMVNDANGLATVNNLSWGEVGSITLTANLTNTYGYLGTSATPTKDALNNILTASGSSATVGAFIPDHFDTAVVATATTPMPCPTGLTCPAVYNGFVYSGQPFSEQVTARNLAGGTTTNYHSAYGLSNNVTLSAWDALGSVVTQNPGGALAINPMLSTAFSSGVGLTNTQAYKFATSPTSPTDIFLRAVDAVNTSVTSRRATPATSVEGGVKVVSGKVKISNANGSELLPLSLTATVQYWNSTSWVTSTTDSITQFNTKLSTAGGNIVTAIVTGLGSGVSVATPGMVTVAAGATTFTLNKPGVVGSTDISMNAPSYLLGSSNGAGVNPSKAGRATFGVYKGPNEFIYLRENY